MTSALYTLKLSSGGGNNVSTSLGGVETCYAASSPSASSNPATAHTYQAQPAPCWEEAWEQGVSQGDTHSDKG